MLTSVALQLIIYYDVLVQFKVKYYSYNNHHSEAPISLEPYCIGVQCRANELYHIILSFLTRVCVKILLFLSTVSSTCIGSRILLIINLLDILKIVSPRSMASGGV